MRKRMKPDTFMPLFIGKWHQDTQHLDATATGAYFLLIMSHWGKSGIPSDNESLRTTTRVREQDWARIKATIEPFFIVHDGLWTSKRCVEEYADAEQIYSKRVQQTASALEARGYSQKPTSNETSNVEINVTSGQEQKQKQSSTKKKEAPLDLEEWIKKIEASPAYAGIDVRRQFEKAKFWISEHRGRVFTHKFFLNWLNRLDVPISGSIISGAPIEPRISPNISLLHNQEALKRVEARIKQIRDSKPINGWPKGDPELKELQELKVERARLIELLGYKA